MRHVYSENQCKQQWCYLQCSYPWQSISCHFIVVNSVNRLFSGWWLWITRFVDHHFYFALTCWIGLIHWWLWSINEYWILGDVSLAALFACIILTKKTKRITVCKNSSELWQDHILSKACYTYIYFFPLACRLKPNRFLHPRYQHRWANLPCWLF